MQPITFDGQRLRIDVSRPLLFDRIAAREEMAHTEERARLKGLEGRLLARMPGTSFVLVMGPPVGHLAPKGTWEIPADALATYRRPNLFIEVMFPITWGGVWDYPYPEAQSLIREMRDLFGAEKLLWGSDMPNAERFCTYRQSLDYVRRHCEFLSGSEKGRILGLNAAELMGIGRFAPTRKDEAA